MNINQEQDLLKRTTELEKELAVKNRELEIEASLERVRVTAMAMKEPADMLQVCRMISDQLLQLGFKEIRNVQTVIIYPQRHEYLNYQYFTPYDKDLIEVIDYRLHPDVLDFTNQMLASTDAYYTKTFKGKELKVWREYRKQTNQLPDPKLDEATSSHYYFYSIGSGALGVTTYAPLNEKEISLFKRFRNVFELAYRRFVDIEKAQAQAREARIEAALERVRAKSMAMHHSDDLISVINIVQEQLLELGFHFHGANFVTDYSEKGYTMWLASPGESFPFKIYVPQIGQKYFESVKDAIEKGSDLATYTLGFDEKNIYFTNLFENSLAKNTSEEVKRKVFESKGMAASVVLLDKVRLNLMNLDLVPFTDEENNILKRFGYVFEQSYTRFLDLQKAEAQAREAQIEAAVEKVRSRSLAMHKSEELQEVVHTVFEKLKELNVDFYTAIIILFTEGSRDIIWWLESKANQQYSKMLVPYTPISYFNDLIKIRESGGDLLSKSYSFDEKNELFHHLFEHTNFKYVPEKQKQFLLEAEFATMSVGLVRNTGIHITSYSKKTFSDQDNQVIKRFANVFDQSYTRFLDLQKAEAQAREAQIQLSLERVRARAMAMYHSDELNDVLSVLFEQFDALNINPVFAHLSLFDLEKNLTTLRITGKRGKRSMAQKTVAIDAMDEWKEELANWKASKPSSISRIYYPKEVVPQIWNLFGDLFGQLPDDSKIYPDDFQNGLYCVQGNTGFGYIGFNHTREATEEEKDIILRFAIEFGRVYQRFLDLQKAEAQAREAKIEAALERTRTQSMIMQHSKELDDTLGVFHEQVLLLGINSAFSFLWLPDEKNERHIFWAAWEEDKNGSTVFNSKAINYPLDRNEPATAQCLVDWKSNEPVYSYHVPPAAVENYFAAWKELLDGVEKLKSEYFQAGLHYVEAFMKYGCFGVMVATDLTDDEKKILNRFAIEFERTYTRFLDLQKAEEQAREAQIEAALERVRAKVMAMTNSKDLNETSLVFGEQLRKLGIHWQFSYFWLVEEAKNENTFWITWPDNKTSFTTYTLAEAEEYFNDCLISWRAGVKIHDNYVPREGVQEWLDTFQRIADDAGGEAKKLMVPQTFAGGVYYYDAMMKYGSFGICINKAATDEEKKIQCRFAIEFERAYTRFLDLKQAEAQARESQIELGLERVRARAMAMQKSNELKELISTVYTELTKLDLILDRCFIMIYDNKSMGVTWWMSNPEAPLQPIGLFVKYHEQPPYQAFIKGWKERNLKWQYVLEGEVKKTWDKFLFVETELSQLPDFVIANMKANEKVCLSASFNNFGCLTLATLELLSDEHFDIMLRFAKVFDLTYTRFNDLKQAEAQAREATIEAALERVRARALAMQEPEELKDVAQVLRTEMGLLGVEELETCSIYINVEATNKTECWYASKDQRVEEKKLVSDHFPLNLNDTWVGREIKKFYRSDAKQVSIVMQGANRKEWINYCEERSVPFRGYYGEVIPDRTYHLYKFSHGAIGAAAAGDISGESWKLLSRAASVFSLAYSRFKDLTQARNDLIQLKEEKKRAEDALTELQTTQKQLIQAEKMASLGELTAGIAHEIQNPLNFVNNFSDVSSELLEEMKHELATGNTEQAIGIVNDVKENLEKILHHGKRADAIVKGMLQHSRASSGQKELTDINVLAEEYLRLAYHGLRAKDKSFNAKFETDLDKSIGKINIISQDVGRVILNLINNAFYAVNEKKSKNANGYEPTVTLSTKKLDDKIEVKVKDNGDGISQKVLDKIFQPFFTTKPTGQGTGLGLSLSYDIIRKGHGGELDVKTKEGEGSEFIISLPIN